MKRSRLVGLGIGVVAAALAACGADRTTSGGSGGTLATGGSFSGLYVAAGSTSIARVELDGSTSTAIEVGGEPTRIARQGSRVYVSLRTERKVAVFEETATGLKLVGHLLTGAEPFGVAATDQRVYVASSVSGRVSEYDASSFAELRAWTLSGEPRSLTLHPSGRALYVAATYGGELTYIDLGSGAAQRVALPEVQSFDFRTGGPIELAKRITADVLVSPDGRRLHLGMLYFDNVSPIPDAILESGEPAPGCGDASGMEGGAVAPPPDGMGGTGTGTGGGEAAPPPPGRPDCGGGGYDNQRFNPTIDTVPVDPVTGAPEPVGGEAISLVSFVTLEDARGNQLGTNAVSGYPSALAISEDGATLYAAIEGAEAVVAMRTELPTGGTPVPVSGGAARAPSSDAAFPSGPGGKNFGFRATLSVRTGAAPRGLAVYGSRLYVHAHFDRRIESIALDDVADVFAYQAGQLVKALSVDFGPNGVPRQLVAGEPLTVSAEAPSAEVETGRRLFYASNNPLMATVGAGVSCATCHFDNRTDGVTWTFFRGPRQTPNLSVDLRNAQPVGWVGNVPTVADEGMSTSQRLMGGQALQPAHAEAIQTFLFGLRPIDTPNRATAADAKVLRGQAVFANVGCASCHNGPSLTDNKQYTMLGLGKVKTRPLSGVAASAPYFHDGSAATLEQVVVRASRGEMGMPFSISPAEAEDLVEYLKSL